MSLASAYLLSAAVVFCLMSSLWVYSLIAKDASIVDRFWGAGYVFIAWAIGLAQEHLAWQQVLLISIVSIWGLRLSIYIHRRNRGHPEDYRYQEMRRHHGARFWWYSFLSVFMLQGALMLMVAAPVIYTLALTEMSELTSLCAFVGTVIWFIGFVFEAGGDYQLAQFKKNPENRGKLLTTGLWSLTRHPNYFGDACQWWGFGLFAWAALPYGAFTFIGPIIMTLFIRKVSGVDLLEKSLKTSKPGYAEYIARTPAFFPIKTRSGQ